MSNGKGDKRRPSQVSYDKFSENWDKAFQEIYEITFWGEVKNGSLHVAVGAIIAHTFIPYLDWWWVVLILLALGAGREYWQHRRGKIQPMYIHILDTITFGLGGLGWWLYKEKTKMEVDKL